MVQKNSKIFIAGHKGLVGSAIIRKLRSKGYNNLITIDKKKLNLTDQKKIFNFIKKKKPKFIFLAAAKVGGIYSNNKYKADFIYQNLTIQNNIIHGAFQNGVKDMIFLGSSCVYPKLSKQPIKENYLLGGYLEETNDAYAIAKIAGIKMCESYNDQYNMNYRCLMPTNTFGPNDNYHKLNSHFAPAMIKKIYDIKVKNKKKLLLWGNGKAKRELIYVEDIADACVYFMNKRVKEDIINIGTGIEYSIKEYAKILLKVINPEKKVKIIFDKSKPNGTPRKVMDIKRAKKYGWKPLNKLENSILKTYKSFLKEINDT